MRIENIIG